MIYKKGDKAKVIANINYHDFEIGSEVEIIEQSKDEGGIVYYAMSDNGDCKWIWHNELE